MPLPLHHVWTEGTCHLGRTETKCGIYWTSSLQNGEQYVSAPQLRVTTTDHIVCSQHAVLLDMSAGLHSQEAFVFPLCLASLTTACLYPCPSFCSLTCHVRSGSGAMALCCSPSQGALVTRLAKRASVKSLLLPWSEISFRPLVPGSHTHLSLLSTIKQSQNWTFPVSHSSGVSSSAGIRQLNP